MYNAFQKESFRFESRYENNLLNHIENSSNASRSKTGLSGTRENLIEIKYKLPRKIKRNNLKELSNINIANMTQEDREDYKLSVTCKILNTETIITLLSLFTVLSSSFIMTNLIFKYYENIDLKIYYFIAGYNFIINSLFNYRANRKDLYNKHFGIEVSSLFSSLMIFILSLAFILYNSIHYFNITNLILGGVGLFIAIIITVKLRAMDNQFNKIEENLIYLSSNNVCTMVSEPIYRKPRVVENKNVENGKIITFTAKPIKRRARG